MKQLIIFALSLVFFSMPAFADSKSDQYAASNSYETVTRMNIDRTGKPPFKRTIETIRVTDIAALELEESKNTFAKSKPRNAFNYKLRH